MRTIFLCIGKKRYRLRCVFNSKDVEKLGKLSLEGDDLLIVAVKAGKSLRIKVKSYSVE